MRGGSKTGRSRTMRFNGTAPRLTLGYDLDRWRLFGEKVPITIDLSPKTNSHMLLCGMSGAGKSYLENQIMTKLALAEPDGDIYCGDYKQEDSYAYLRQCRRYYGYKDTLAALDIVHGRLLARQSGEDTSRNPVTLIWDEYVAQMLALMSEDRQAAATTMSAVSETLMLGRGLGPIRLITSCQRPDSIVYPAGSRLNYGVVVVLGAAVRSIYEMLLPDFMDEVKGRHFGRGEGVALLQGSELHFIKVGAVSNPRRMEEICIKALGGKK